MNVFKSNNLFAHRIDLIKIMNEENYIPVYAFLNRLRIYPITTHIKNRAIQLGFKPLVNFNPYHL